jgi:hypothetical protein
MPSFVARQLAQSGKQAKCLLARHDIHLSRASVKLHLCETLVLASRMTHCILAV